MERGSLRDIYQFETLKDDHVVEPWMQAGWHVKVSDYGVQAVVHQSEADVTMGSRNWEPPIKDLDKDLDKLHPRTYSVDREATAAAVEKLTGVFEGILPVRIRRKYWWTMGLTWPAIDLIGLESLMLSMYDNPDGLHRLMTFLRDDHLAYAKWLEAEGLLCLDNENDYIGSGTMGYTRDLPAADHQEGQPIRMADTWVLSESQETVGVSPDMFEKFIFPYQLSIVENFGKCYYGCCEPVNSRWHVVKKLPNLARVSVSPWADEDFMAEALGRDYVYSRKPNPAQISTGRVRRGRHPRRPPQDARRDPPAQLPYGNHHEGRPHPPRPAGKAPPLGPARPRGNRQAVTGPAGLPLGDVAVPRFPRGTPVYGGG